MVIEYFKPGKKGEVYERFQREGRFLPEGLFYIDSWVELDGNRCFQLMETNTPILFEEWIAHWSDLVDFEIVPIEQ